MAFDPCPIDPMSCAGLDKFLPKLGIFDGLLGSGEPAIALPAENPLGDPVLHIIAVGAKRDMARLGQCFEPANRGEQFHPVVGGQRFTPRQFFLTAARPDEYAPATGAGIAFACAVGCDFYFG